MGLDGAARCTCWNKEATDGPASRMNGARRVVAVTHVTRRLTWVCAGVASIVAGLLSNHPLSGDFASRELRCSSYYVVNSARSLDNKKKDGGRVVALPRSTEK